jgi:hypothetical protein
LIPSIIGFEQGSEFRDFYNPEVIDAGIRATKLQDADEIRSLREGIASFEDRGIPLLAASSAANLGPQSPTTASGQLLGGRRTPGQGEDERDLRLEAQTPQPGMFRRSAQAAEQVRGPLDQPTPIREGQVVPELFNKQAMEERRRDPPIDLRGEILKEADRIKQFEEQRDPDDPTVTDEEIASTISYLQDPGDADDDVIYKPESQQRAEAEEEIEQQRKTAQQDETNLYDKLRQLAEDRVTAAEEDAEFNKFLALAQMGAALAQSDRGFVGAIGEGIEAGLPTLAASRKGLREAEEGILDTEIDIAKIQADKPDVLTQKQRLDLADKITGRILSINEQLAEEQELGRTPDPRRIAELEQLKAQQFALRQSLSGILAPNIPTDAQSNLAMLGAN